MSPVARERTVGDRIRELRGVRGISIRKLAVRTAFSASFISQVENGQASPSIHSLERLAEALGVTLGEFFAPPERRGVQDLIVKAGARQQLISSWSNAQIDALAPMGGDRPLEPVLMTLEPGGRSGSHPHPHLMEEFGYVIEGEVCLALGDERHLLGAGDAATIPANQARFWENVGTISARVLVVAARFRR